MANDAVEKVVNAQAWTEFCDLLKKAGEVILREDLELSTFDRAEGLRYLSRLLRAGFTSFIENPGPLHPVFRPMADMVKMGLDNPDNYYVSASVNPRETYRIRGRRQTIHYMSFAAQTQNFAARDKITGGAGHLNDAEIALEPDGSYRIVVGPQDPGVPNWIDTTGHPEGFLTPRWAYSATPPQKDWPTISARKVAFDQIRDHLPEETRHVSPEERRDQIRIRQAHVLKRYRVF